MCFNSFAYIQASRTILLAFFLLFLLWQVGAGTDLPSSVLFSSTFPSKSLEANPRCNPLSFSDTSRVSEKQSELKASFPRVIIGAPEISWSELEKRSNQKAFHWEVTEQGSDQPVADFKLFLYLDQHWVALDPETFRLNQIPKERGALLRLEAEGYIPMMIHPDALRGKDSFYASLAPQNPSPAISFQSTFFDRGSAALDEQESLPYLKKLAIYLSQHPQLTIRLSGHTDNFGNPRLNKELSLQRARAVRDYLLSLGVDFEQMRIAGWGGSRPIDTNETESGRQQNRRVDVAIDH